MSLIVTVDWSSQTVGCRPGASLG